MHYKMITGVAPIAN